MTPEERAWCDRIHQQAMNVYACCGAALLHMEKGTKAWRLVHEGELAALALATEGMTRVRDADMQAAASDPERFDLGALAVDLGSAAPE